jgi:hypothetical protein
VPFASQSMHTNNVGLDFGAIGFVPTRVQFEFLDQGGSENLSVNGSVRCSVGRKLLGRGAAPDGDRKRGGGSGRVPGRVQSRRVGRPDRLPPAHTCSAAAG